MLRLAKIGRSHYAYVGKSRLPSFQEGDRFDWTYQSFADRWGRDVIEKEAQPIDLATPEQLTELKQLLEVVRMPDDWTEKCLKKARAEEWEEMDAGKLDLCIKALKERVRQPATTGTAPAAAVHDATEHGQWTEATAEVSA